MKAINKYFNFQKYFNYLGIKQLDVFFTVLIFYIIGVSFFLSSLSIADNFTLFNLSSYGSSSIILNIFIFLILMPMLLICVCFKLFSLVFQLVKLFLFKQQYFFSINFLNEFLSSNADNAGFFTITDVYSMNAAHFLQDIFSFFSDVSINYLDYPLFFYFGLFFLMTSFLSLVALNYLGFYGVFVLNLTSIICF
jgi:hypothetical protein